MKILRVIAGADPAMGGPIEGVKLSAAVMRDLGHETEMVTLDDPGADYLADIPFPVHPQGKWFRKYGYTPRLARWIAANGQRFDAAVVHGLWNHASVGGWWGLRKARLPYVVFTHGMMDPWFRERYPLKHLAKQAFWALAQGNVLRDAETVLFTCEEERRLASGVFRGPAYKETVVAYGSAAPPREGAGDEAAFRGLVPTLGDRPYLLFLSRIHPKKGCDMLVEAFAEIASRSPAMDLVIAGPDQVGIKANLLALAREAGVAGRIHWPGMVSGSAKYGAFRGAEAFVLPSHQENFGIVVAEALACRCPVLISDKVNIWREVAEAGAGIVESDTVAGTVQLLQRFLALSADERMAMRNACEALYLRRFTSRAAGEDLAGVLAGITRRPAGGMLD